MPYRLYSVDIPNGPVWVNISRFSLPFSDSDDNLQIVLCCAGIRSSKLNR